MSQYFQIHLENPQNRLIQQAAEIVQKGGVIVYPTDSGYALGCHLGDKAALERICQIRQLDMKHHFTVICKDLAQVGVYVKFETPVFRLLKANTPEAYTFILKATKEVPRRLMHPKQKTIGIRIPDHPVALALLEALDEPMMTTTLILPDHILPMSDPLEIRRCLEKQIDLVIDGGIGGTIPTTLIDLTDDVPLVIREGKGSLGPFF